MNYILLCSALILLFVSIRLLSKNKRLERAIGDTADSKPSDNTELQRLLETSIDEAINLFKVVVSEANATEARRNYVIAFVLTYNDKGWFTDTFARHKDLTASTLEIIEPFATGGIPDTATLQARIAYAELSETYDHLNKLLNE